MKNALIALAALCLLGCTPETSVEIVNRIQDKCTVIVIDDCQYIFVENGVAIGNNYAFSLTHKGNCTNSIHAHSK